MFDIPITLLAAYTVYRFLLYYQRVHLKQMGDAAAAWRIGLTVFAVLAAVYALGFLLYWGFTVSWLQVLVLLAVASLVHIGWSLLESALGLDGTYRVFSLIGLVGVPVCGVLMWTVLPG
jgi:hypothetical protein